MDTARCPEEEKTKMACPCLQTECVNHRRCCHCIAAHRKSGKLTACRL